MRKIDWNKPIIGADGVERNRAEIEKFFTDEFEEKIRQGLQELYDSLREDQRPQFRSYIEYILSDLHIILLKNPKDLERLKLQEDKMKLTWRNLFGISDNEIKSILGQIQDKFYYSQFRDFRLNKLAVVLNVKTCLYCNQQYTIAVGKNPNRNGEIDLRGSKAFLQFDHFYGETEYPIMSMSLYNLIPSCPLCNQKKSKNHLSLKLHPYESDLGSKLRFRIKKEDAFINPKSKDLDLLEVEIDTFGDEEVKAFTDNLALEKRYARHLDIVEELEVAMYMTPYYDGYFSDIQRIFAGADGSCSPERMRTIYRHFKGFYADPADINRRPLTKFSQDIFAQLCGWREGL